jgi:hypothetical protein
MLLAHILIQSCQQIYVTTDELLQIWKKKVLKSINFNLTYILLAL